MTWYKREGEAYRTTAKKSYKGVLIPAGFRFNISSPKWAHWFVHPHDDRFFEAACFHDYVILRLDWGRMKAAKLWYKVLGKRRDVPYWKRLITTVALGLWPGKDK